MKFGYSTVYNIRNTFLENPGTKYGKETSLRSFLEKS